MRIKIVLIIACLFTTVSFAQDKRLPWEGSVQAGLLEGKKGSAFQFGVMGGLRSKTWTTSIGTGLDYYGIRSIPVYLQVNKKILDRSNTPYLYLGSGYNFPWFSTNGRGETNGTGGFCYHAGIGYQVPVMLKTFLFFAAGYSYKQYTERITGDYICVTTPCPGFIDKYYHRFRRLSITTGLRF